MNDFEKYKIFREMTEKIKSESKRKDKKLIGNLANEDKEILKHIQNALEQYEVNNEKVFNVDNYTYYILIFTKPK